MAHPGSEAAIDNYQEEDAEIDLSATTPHVTKPLTLDEAAAELSTFFEASDTEQAIDRKEYEDQKAQAEDLKNLKIDKNGNLDPNGDEFTDAGDAEVEEITYDQAEEDPTDQEQEFDEQGETDEASAIPAPVSWSKEQKEVFEALPPNAQNVIVERERERDKGFQVKATELAEQRKNLQALEQQTIVERQMYASSLSERLAAEMVPPDDRMLDPHSPAYNPDQYYADRETFDGQVAQQEFLQLRAAQYDALAQDNEKFALMEHLKENDHVLSQSVPDWENSEHRHNLFDYGGNFGFSATEIQSASPAEVALLDKAMKYDVLMSQKPDLRAKLKKAPKVQKPGAKSKTGTSTRNLAAAQKKLRRSGSVQDAAAVLSHIMKD